MLHLPRFTSRSVSRTAAAQRRFGLRSRSPWRGAPLFVFSWVCYGVTVGSPQPGWAQLGVTSLVWQSLGPTAAPARVSALAVDPHNDLSLSLAAPGGGIWNSGDSGNSWSPVMDSAYSLQVCSVAFDPSVPGVVYAGTGD